MLPLILSLIELMCSWTLMIERSIKPKAHHDYSSGSHLASNAYLTMWLKAPTSSLLALYTVFGLLTGTAHSLGSQCTAPLTQGSAAAGDPFWMENIAHQGMFMLVVSTQTVCFNNPRTTPAGIAAFNSDPATYTVFRNVKVRRMIIFDVVRWRLLLLCRISVLLETA